MENPGYDKRLGLTVREEKILQVIAVEACTISLIAKRSHLPRTSLLYMLRSLERRGLVLTEMMGRRVLWRSASIPHGTSEGAQPFVVYHGLPALRGIFHLWKNLPKNTRVIGFQPDKSLRYSVRKNGVAEWEYCNEYAKKNKLIIEAVVHERSVYTFQEELGPVRACRIYDSFIGRLEDYVRLPDGYADVESEFYIFRDVAYVINWRKEIAIAIHDPSMVDLCRMLFSVLKEYGVRYSQNEKMKHMKEAVRR